MAECFSLKFTVCFLSSLAKTTETVYNRIVIVSPSDICRRDIQNRMVFTLDRMKFDMRFAAARRDIIERDFEKLNPVQREAVYKTEGPLLILAGAGSGKTTVLINRIVNIIRYGKGYESETAPAEATMDDLVRMYDYLDNPASCDKEEIRALCAEAPAKPWQILAITFTNTAAKELKERLERALGEGANDIWAATFHSACVRILRRDIERLGFTKSFTIYDDDEHLNVIRAIIREKNLDEKVFIPRAIAGEISRAKDELKMPGAFAREAGDDFRKKIVAEIYSTYQKRLRNANALDFDDIIIYTVALLQNHEDVREYYQRKFRYVMIDEYQDTNYAQYMLAKLLTGDRGNICVVGDDDQSIYRFRGATIENILNFEQEFQNATVIRLEQNYRSTKKILAAANEVIRHNEGRKGKELWTQNDDGYKIAFYQGYSEQDEAQYVAASILGGYSAGLSARDCAILYRLNAQSNMIEAALKKNGIPYRMIGGVRFFDRTEIRDMLAYLWSIANHDDDLRLKRIINTPARKISAKRVEDAEALAEEHGVSVYEICRQASQYGVFDRAAAPMEQFASMLEELRQLSLTMPLDEFYDIVLERTGYLAALEAKTDPESIARVENIKELKTNILDYVRTHDEQSLEGFLEEVALFTDIDKYDAGADAVVMMTIHSAKGLEFPSVYLVGMEEGIFPSYRSLDEQTQLEEERRLCYVGITRAEKVLHISCAKSRTIFGKTSYNKMSRFVEEIPLDYIDRTIEEPRTRNDDTDDFTMDGEPRTERTRRSTYTPRRPYIPPRSYVGTPQQKGGVTGMSGTTPGAVAAKKTPPPLYRVGDKLNHKVFGNGVVTALHPMGGDMLLTIQFETKGEKRLMANTAAKMLSKI